MYLVRDATPHKASAERATPRLAPTSSVLHPAKLKLVSPQVEASLRARLAIDVAVDVFPQVRNDGGRHVRQCTGIDSFALCRAERKQCQSIAEQRGHQCRCVLAPAQTRRVDKQWISLNELRWDGVREVNGTSEVKICIVADVRGCSPLTVRGVVAIPSQRDVVNEDAVMRVIAAE